jgi:hypothetical protein
MEGCLGKSSLQKDGLGDGSGAGQVIVTASAEVLNSGES